MLAAYMYLNKKAFSIREIIKPSALKKVWVITVLGGVGIFLQMLALKYTLVIYVIAIKRASGMFSVFLWYVFFGEKDIPQKLFAAAIMLAWVLIISILWNI
jgi:drug/metabolite transporter (DMT)-like permease